MLAQNKISRHFAIIIATVMLAVTVMAGASPAYATLTSIPAATQIESVTSSKYFKDEYYKVTTPADEDYTIYVEGKTKIPTKRFCIRLKKHGGDDYITVFVVPNANGEFSIKINTALNNTDIPEVINGKGTVATADETYGNQPGYNAVGTIPAGTYHLTIARATTTTNADISHGTKWWLGELGGDEGRAYAYKEVLLTVKKNNNPKVVYYPAAMKNNTKITNSYENRSDSVGKKSYVRYQDKYLRDMAFVLASPSGSNSGPSGLTAKELAYLQKVAKQVTAGASTNYQKLLKIYEYTAGNFYYDVLANTKAQNQYANPYKNIYCFRNKISAANAKSGKVATTCQGYSAIVIALARASGIPARLVYGHHISQPVDIWSGQKASNISKRDHWWAEAWVDGRWVVIDANNGTASKWNRTSFKKSGTWTKAKNISYSHFDPSPEQMSTTYASIGVYSGAMDGKYINKTTEINQLKKFLNTKSSGKTNGKRLNSKYSATNYATWNNGKASSFKTDGFGQVTHISWGDKKMYGTMNLSGFNKLKYLTVHSNKIKTLTLTKCSSLISVSASYNNLTKFDSSASKKTTTVNTKGNKLTNAKFYGGKTITIKTNNSKAGSFSFKYSKSGSKKLYIYANDAKKGYKYQGIYNKSGKKLTSKKTYSTSKPLSSYTVKYKKK